MQSTVSNVSNTIDTTLAAAGSKATYTGSGMILSGWFFSSEFAVLVGITASTHKVPPKAQ